MANRDHIGWRTLRAVLPIDWDEEGNTCLTDRSILMRAPGCAGRTVALTILLVAGYYWSSDAALPYAEVVFGVLGMASSFLVGTNLSWYWAELKEAREDSS